MRMVNASPLTRLTGAHSSAIEKDRRQIRLYIHRGRLSWQRCIHILFRFAITIRGQLLTNLVDQVVDLPRGNRNLSHDLKCRLRHVKSTGDGRNVENTM